MERVVYYKVHNKKGPSVLWWMVKYTYLFCRDVKKLIYEVNMEIKRKKSLISISYLMTQKY